MKNKKAQIAGQILIYVLAIIIFSMTLLYGYKAIKYFTDSSTEISYLQLENDIKNEIEKVKGDSVGTVKKKVLQIPGNYKDVCFISTFGFGTRGMDTYLLIQQTLDSTKNNMFLAPPGNVGFDIGDIKVESPYCISILGSRVTLRLESMGDHVKVSEWV